MEPELTLREVNERLASYGTADVTGHLFYLGEILINEVIGRTAQIESKAMTALGFSVGGLVLLLFEISTQATSLFVGGMRALSGLALFGGGVNAYLALRLRTWRWVSEATWFPAIDELVDDEAARLLQIRHSHLRELFEIRRAMHAANEDKSSHLKAAQHLLLVAAGCLVAAVLAELLS